MQSQIMNSYHQARYRNIGHKRVNSVSDSSTSESSCNQNSPEYLNSRNIYTPSIKLKHTYIKKMEESGQYLNNDRLDQNESEHDDAHSTEDQIEMSSDEEEISPAENISNIYKTVNNEDVIYEPNKQTVENDVLDDNQEIDGTLCIQVEEEEEINLVEGTDYDVIHYYAVNPNTSIEGSDDEIDSPLTSDLIEVVSVDPNAEQINDSISTDIESPSISNIDDYYPNKEDELTNCKEETEENEVNEYFHKSSTICKEETEENEVNEYFNKSSTICKEETEESEVNEYFNTSSTICKEETEENEVNEYFRKSSTICKEETEENEVNEYFNKSSTICKEETEENEVNEYFNESSTICKEETEENEVNEYFNKSSTNCKEETKENEVNEYFNKSFTNCKEETEENEVNEYFNNSSELSDASKTLETLVNTNTSINETNRVNIDDLFLKHKPLQETLSHRIDKCMEIKSEPLTAEKSGINSEEVTNVMELILNPHKDETDEPFPHLEDLKKFFGDVPDTSLKSKPHRSCSFPTSPMRNFSIDVDVIKPSLTFEDLDLYLSDLALDNNKDKSFGIDYKIDDVPHILTDEDVNSFFITDANPVKVLNSNSDDLTHQDMELENAVQSPLCIRSSTPIPSSDNVTVISPEKSAPKMNKCNMEVEDFIDVESCNDVVIPVLEANNVSSLLEQFEATEKLNSNRKSSEPNEAKNGLVSGMRLHDASVHLHKYKMRKVLMMNTPVMKRSPSPVLSDHDYCSPKKSHNLSKLKSGQSLLKPEVLSSNNEILNSRHRSCKNKLVDYHQSSDEESARKSKKNSKTKDVKNKKSKKKCNTSKLSPPHSNGDASSSNNNCNSTVIPNDTPSDNNCSQPSGSIKLTIKNKSVIINNSNLNKSEENMADVKSTDKFDNAVILENKSNHVNNNKVDTATKNIKTEVTKPEQFYNELFSNKSDVKLPYNINSKNVKKSFEDEMKLITFNAVKKESEQSVKKKKLNLQEYKRRKGVSSNNSSAAVSPELIFPDMKCHTENVTVAPKTRSNEMVNEKPTDLPKAVFDPIREASRKILLKTKKKKEKIKQEEDIVIPKVEITDLLPLIAAPDITTPNKVPTVTEKRLSPNGYEEIILVSVGTNTDGDLQMKVQTTDVKPHINFKIKKSDHVSKQNVFDPRKNEKSRSVEGKSENVSNKDRYRDITATLKSVEKKVDTRITSNSLFASIQDVVMKKATKDVKRSDKDNSRIKSNSLTEKFGVVSSIKTEIVRDYDEKMEHGEDKVILHLEKCRIRPTTSNSVTQTDVHEPVQEIKMASPVKRTRKDSDMSIESESSPVRSSTQIEKQIKVVKPPPSKQSPIVKTDVVESKRSRSKEKVTSHKKRSRSRDKKSRSKVTRSTRRSRSKDRRSRSRHRVRHRSRSRNRRSCSRSHRSKSRRSRSYDHYRYRRSKSPFRTSRRLRSPYRSRRSPSYNRDYCKRSRSKSKSTNRGRIASPAPKKIKLCIQTNDKVKKLSPSRSLNPRSMRKPTISESSTSSSSSSSNSSSSRSTSCSEKSRDSYKSQKSFIYKNDPVRRKGPSPFALEDRENNTPVEERRIVFVGKLERDITKHNLRSKFSKFGFIIEVRIHSKEDGSRYGFVTYDRARDAWTAVESASQFPQYDVGFGGRRAFCRQTYADLDGLKEYSESSFHGPNSLPSRHDEDMSFEQMLLDVKQKLSQRKNDQKQENP